MPDGGYSLPEPQVLRITPSGSEQSASWNHFSSSLRARIMACAIHAGVTADDQQKIVIKLNRGNDTTSPMLTFTCAKPDRTTRRFIATLINRVAAEIEKNNAPFFGSNLITEHGRGFLLRGAMPREGSHCTTGFGALFDIVNAGYLEPNRTAHQRRLHYPARLRAEEQWRGGNITPVATACETPRGR